MSFLSFVKNNTDYLAHICSDKNKRNELVDFNYCRIV